MGAANYSHVTLVVDPDFGERAKAQADLGPLWVIQSSQNTPVIKELWATGKPRFVDAPTYFDAVPGRTPEDSAEVCIGTVHDHHPAWRTFEVIGTPLSPRLLAAMQECASGTAKETPAGFIYLRDENSN